MPRTRKTTTKQAYALQVRPSVEVRAKLKEAAAAAGRTLTKEMERRLAASVGESTDPDAGLYGWSNPNRAKLLGQAIGILAGAIQDTSDADDSARILAMLKLAAADLFDGLGAHGKNLSEEGKIGAKLYAKEMVNQMRWANLAAPVDRTMYPAEGIVADLGKAWGVKTGKDKGET